MARTIFPRLVALGAIASLTLAACTDSTGTQSNGTETTSPPPTTTAPTEEASRAEQAQADGERDQAIAEAESQGLQTVTGTYTILSYDEAVPYMNVDPVTEEPETYVPNEGFAVVMLDEPLTLDVLDIFENPVSITTTMLLPSYGTELESQGYTWQSAPYLDGEEVVLAYDPASTMYAADPTSVMSWTDAPSGGFKLIYPAAPEPQIPEQFAQAVEEAERAGDSYFVGTIDVLDAEEIRRYAGVKIAAENEQAVVVKLDQDHLFSRIAPDGNGVDTEEFYTAQFALFEPDGSPVAPDKYTEGSTVLVTYPPNSQQHGGLSWTGTPIRNYTVIEDPSGQ